MRIPTLFRIWYSTTYTVLFAILLLLLAISPADTMYQSIRSREYQKLSVIGGVYLLTILVVLLVYSTRLYTNRSVLQAIPKPYVPIEDGEVGKNVRRMIVKALRRSAIVAWDARPRDVRDEAGAEDGENRGAQRTQTKSKHAQPATIIPISATDPPWGRISHPGWASPESLQTPILQYSSVINELSHLIEAKAVSLAPPDPDLEDIIREQGAAAHATPHLPDAQIVNLLQRPRTMGLRDYLRRLSFFGLVNPPELTHTFLALYEEARFSTKPVSERLFADIMAVFADVLTGMSELDMDALAAARTDADFEIYSQASSGFSGSSTPRSARSWNSRPASASTTGLPYATPMPHRQSSYAFPRTPSARSQTAPSLSDGGSVLRHRVRPAQAQGRVSSDSVQPRSSASETSMRSQSQGSVIRLRRGNVVSGELPYEYVLDGGDYGDG